MPTAAEAARFTTEELLTTLRRFGVNPDFGAFEDALLREARDLGRLGTGDMSAAATQRVRDSIERAFRTTVAQATKGLVRDYGMAAQIAAGAQGHWLAVSLAVGDEATCEDCDGFHGEERTLDEWMRDGRPGSASRQCRANCRCELVPVRPEGESAADAGEEAMREAAE